MRACSETALCRSSCFNVSYLSSGWCTSAAGAVSRCWLSASAAARVTATLTTRSSRALKQPTIVQTPPALCSWLQTVMPRYITWPRAPDVTWPRSRRPMRRAQTNLILLPPPMPTTSTNTHTHIHAIACLLADSAAKHSPDKAPLRHISRLRWRQNLASPTTIKKTHVMFNVSKLWVTSERLYRWNGLKRPLQKIICWLYSDTILT